MTDKGKPRLTERTRTNAAPSDLFARRAYEVMVDGGWHDFVDLLHDLGRLVPPSMALRRADQLFKNARDRNGIARTGERRHGATTPELKIASGRRAYVREFLNNGSAYERDAHSDKWRMVRMPASVKSDLLRAEVLRPILDALHSTFEARGDEWSAGQVQLTAHEYGFHLSSCPPGCELLPFRRHEVAEGE